jgi:hypothetical protein
VCCRFWCAARARSNLAELYLSRNRLTGGVPSTLGGCLQLKYFKLDGQRCTPILQARGVVPVAVCLLPRLRALKLPAGLELPGCVQRYHPPVGATCPPDVHPMYMMVPGRQPQDTDTGGGGGGGTVHAPPRSLAPEAQQHTSSSATMSCSSVAGAGARIAAAAVEEPEPELEPRRRILSPSQKAVWSSSSRSFKPADGQPISKFDAADY